jgi:hypothetical protein
MGCYVNPPNSRKEEWLGDHGTSTGSEPCEITDTHLPVCLVHNGAFTAAAVVFSSRELEAMQLPKDRRSKTWYRVSRVDLRKVSDLEKFEKSV